MRKTRHCWWCGKDLGCEVDARDLETCGHSECEREARNERRSTAEERVDAALNAYGIDERGEYL